MDMCDVTHCVSNDIVRFTLLANKILMHLRNIQELCSKRLNYICRRRSIPPKYFPSHLSACPLQIA